MASPTYKELIEERRNPKPKIRAADLIDDGFPANLGIDEAPPRDEGPGPDDEIVPW
jgi:hypothetical protein